MRKHCTRLRAPLVYLSHRIMLVSNQNRPVIAILVSYQRASQPGVLSED